MIDGLRRAAEADVPALAAIALTAYAHYVPRLGREPLAMRPDFATYVPAGQCWLVEREGAPVAYLVAYPDGDGWLLDHVAVLPAHQGRGLGRALLAHAEDMARAAGTPVIRLYTNEVMTENQALYRRLGWRETGRRARHGMRIVDFEKRLAGSKDTD